MPKVSRGDAPKLQDFGVAEDRSDNLDGYTVNFVSIRQDHDLGPMLAALPGGSCPCPHWGYVTKGRLTVRYDDHEEVLEAGDAFFMTPGHSPRAVAGTEFVQFSPAAELAAVETALAAAIHVAPDGP